MIPRIDHTIILYALMVFHNYYFQSSLIEFKFVFYTIFIGCLSMLYFIKTDHYGVDYLKCIAHIGLFLFVKYSVIELISRIYGFLFYFGFFFTSLLYVSLVLLHQKYYTQICQNDTGKILMDWINFIIMHTKIIIQTILTYLIPYMIQTYYTFVAVENYLSNNTVTPLIKKIFYEKYLTLKLRLGEYILGKMMGNFGSVNEYPDFNFTPMRPSEDDGNVADVSDDDDTDSFKYMIPTDTSDSMSFTKKSTFASDQIIDDCLDEVDEVIDKEIKLKETPKEKPIVKSRSPEENKQALRYKISQKQSQRTGKAFVPSNPRPKKNPPTPTPTDIQQVLNSPDSKKMMEQLFTHDAQTMKMVEQMIKQDATKNLIQKMVQQTDPDQFKNIDPEQLQQAIQDITLNKK